MHIHPPAKTETLWPPSCPGQPTELFPAATGDIGMSRPEREKSATILSPRGFRSQKQKSSSACFLSPALTPQHPARGWPRSKHSVVRPQPSPTQDNSSPPLPPHPIRAELGHPGCSRSNGNAVLPSPHPTFLLYPPPHRSILSKSRTVCGRISTVLPGLTRGRWAHTAPPGAQARAPCQT